jgi:superfamily II DNA or RNA helicase
METVKLNKLDETWLHIDADLGIVYEIDTEFQYEVPNARFHPKVKAHIWDGIIHLVNVYKKISYVGLYRQIGEFCEGLGYRVEYDPDLFAGDTSFDEIKGYVDSLNIHSNDVKLEINDHQYDAIFECISNDRRIIESPTASGKSVMVYAISRYYLSKKKKVLIVAPTTGLVLQMFGDFQDYSSDNKFNAEKYCHIIMEGREKNSPKPVFISTWQSIFRQPKSWFEQFDVIIVDEVHLAKAASLVKIMENVVKAKYRFGFTGSLDKSLTHKKMLSALFSEPARVATTRQLIDQGKLSDIEIKALVLQYPKEITKIMKHYNYDEEIDYIVRNPNRNIFIRKLVSVLKGNTLVLFNFVEKHGEMLFEEIKNNCPDHHVFFIHGKIAAEERDRIRKLTETLENVIIVASSGTMSTGTNIRRLHNVVFTSPTKSFIRVIQSIGRGLRLAGDKTILKLFDIADDLRHGKRRNFAFKHYAIRLGYYAEERFNYAIREIPFTG